MPQGEPIATASRDALLEAVTDAIVALHVRYYHRVPTSARSQLLGDDLIACTLAGVYTDVEKTLIELQRQDVVRETRHSFETAMQHKFIAAVEAITGRSVTAFFTNHHVGPDVAVELFLLAPEQ